MGKAAAFKYHASAVDTSGDTERVNEPVIFYQVTINDLASIRRHVRAAVAAGGHSGPAAEELIVAANEAASNIVRHGFGGQPADISVTVLCGPGYLTVTLVDGGPPFDPASAPKPDTSLPLEQRPFGGLGVQLMRELCDELRYRRIPPGLNELTLVKRMSD